MQGVERELVVAGLKSGHVQANRKQGDKNNGRQPMVCTWHEAVV